MRDAKRRRVIILNAHFQEQGLADWLENTLRALKSAPPDRRLDQLEPAVWARIDGRGEGRAGAGEAVFAFRTAAVVCALLLGVATGGLAASSWRPSSDEISVFSLGPKLAPSTLLEGPARGGRG